MQSAEWVTTAPVAVSTEAQPALVHWCTWRVGGAGIGVSYALLTPEGPVLVDPLLRVASADAALWSLLGPPPVATVLTSDWHERDCYRVRERFGTPVWAPRAGLPAHGGELDGRPDHTYTEETPLPGGLRAHAVSGVFAGEHLLSWTAPSGERVLFTGDTVHGQVNPEAPNVAREHWGHAPSLYLGASHVYVEWLADPDRLRTSLRRALDRLGPIDLLCSAHSLPYGHRTQEALAQLLALDWRALLLAGSRPIVYTRLLEATDFGTRHTFPLKTRAP